MSGKYGRRFATVPRYAPPHTPSEGNFPHYTMEEIETALPTKRSKYSHLKTLRRARGFTLEILSELTGISPSYLSRLEGGARRLNTDLLERLSTVLGCQPGDLLNPTSAPNSTQRLFSHSAGSAPIETSPGAARTTEPQKDLPVYAFSPVFGESPSEQAQARVDFSAPADWTFRPPQLIGVSKAFALYASNDDFGPKYASGDTLFVHPSRPLSAGCSVVVVTREDATLVRQFHGWEPHAILLMPLGRNALTAEIEALPKEHVKAVYKVIGTMES